MLKRGRKKLLFTPPFFIYNLFFIIYGERKKKYFFLKRRYVTIRKKENRHQMKKILIWQSVLGGGKMSLKEKYGNTHDLHLSEWGPFSKRYYGISHIADQKKGLRFDLSVIPSYYRAKYLFPDALRDCGIYPWETTTDLSYYSYRYEMEWKDRVYADVSYYAYDEQTRVIRCRFVNHTEIAQNTSVSLMASIEPPLVSLKDRRIMEYGNCTLPEGAVYVDALSYTDLTYHTARPTDHLVYEGLFRGEKRESGFVNGSALADGFGEEQGDRVTYSFQIEKEMKHPVFLVRYRAGRANVFDVGGCFHQQIILPKTDRIAVCQFPARHLKAGRHDVVLTAHGAGGLALDGFVICEAKEAEKVSFETEHWNRKPLLDRMENSLILDYPDAPVVYGLKWQSGGSIVKEYLTDCMEDSLRRTFNFFGEQCYDHGGQGHYTVPVLYPFHLKPHTTETVYAVVTCGTKEQVAQKIQSLSIEPEEMDALYQKRRVGRIQFHTNTAGQSYQKGIERMAAVIQNNMVFPIYVHGDYIRHNTPGKGWDCLYTWDSGFIGLALSMLSEERALDILNAYLTEPGFPHAAFVHFGSPVPVQFYLFLEIMNRYGTDEHLKYFYPRLKQYYEFLAGKSGGSVTNRLGSDLLQTWDYFYNSGGWDDYPPQVFIHEKGLAGSVAPVITNCHVIRIGKMMAVFAEQLGKAKEAQEYYKDVKRFEKAIQKHAWDEKSGYFGYVVHDERGKPIDILRDAEGRNFNMGLDGVYPLIAGIATPAQKKTLMSHLKSERELWTSIGISTVDQSAPYYHPCGYWNGAVWMAHQWFLFKTMLDLNETDFARKIAFTALQLWKEETDQTYHCYEHFLVQGGRGAGWHDFSALSGPVVNWFFSYFVVGNFTCGFDVFVENRHFEEDFTGFSADLRIEGETEVAVLLTLCEGVDYRFRYREKTVKARAVFDGVYEIILPAGTRGRLIAEKVRKNK